MILIYSKVNAEQLLHIIFRRDDFRQGRQEIIPPMNFIQCSALQMEAGHTFRPHYHIEKLRTETKKAQESWVIVSGAVKVTFYDIDNRVIRTATLTQGDASFTLHGGHTYEALIDNTIVYEYKTGPYEGQENDKRFI